MLDICIAFVSTMSCCTEYVSEIDVPKENDLGWSFGVAFAPGKQDTIYLIWTFCIAFEKAWAEWLKNLGTLERAIWQKYLMIISNIV
jgi:hypothetical protein